MVSATSARPSGGRPEVPAKMTSSILPPRSDLALCSPMTQARASTTLDLPDPLGPTTAVIPGSNRRVVAEAKDLNPRRVKVLRYIRPPVLVLRRAPVQRARRAWRFRRKFPVSSLVSPLLDSLVGEDYRSSPALACTPPMVPCMDAERGE